MTDDMKTLVDTIEQTPILYLGNNYYYSTATDQLYVRSGKKLIPINKSFQLTRLDRKSNLDVPNLTKSNRFIYEHV